jgi:hypothetical protein
VGSFEDEVNKAGDDQRVRRAQELTRLAEQQASIARGKSGAEQLRREFIAVMKKNRVEQMPFFSAEHKNTTFRGSHWKYAYRTDGWAYKTRGRGMGSTEHYSWISEGPFKSDILRYGPAKKVDRLDVSARNFVSKYGATLWILTERASDVTISDVLEDSLESYKKTLARAAAHLTEMGRSMVPSDHAITM